MNFSFEIDTKGVLAEEENGIQKDSSQNSTESTSILSKLQEFKQSLEEECNIEHKSNGKPTEKSRITNKIRNKLLSKELIEELKQEPDKIKKSKLKMKSSNKTLEDIQKEARKVLKKSIVLKPEFEKLKAVPSYELSKRMQLKEKKAEREKTKGKNWFNLPATEMTEEVKRDLEILQMRSVLDPKHFYKKNDLKTLPRYFQVGNVMDSPLDFYSSRLTKKERKKTLVDELLADAEFQKYNKRKFKDIIDEKQKTHYKAWRQAKRLKKKK